jgi:ubiquitin carboxyl-terminal hydrolase 25/28
MLVAITGKTAPRLINDLLDYDPKARARNDKNLLADPAPLFREGVRHEPRTSPSDCRHSLMRKAHTEAPASNDERPTAATKYMVMAYCSQCRYHFQIIATFHQHNGRQAPCCLSDDANPMHHLQIEESIYARDNPSKYALDKYNNFLEYHRWVCSAPYCPLVLEIKISPPRLHDSILSLILSPERVLARGKKVVAQDPVRYDGLGPLTVLQILGNLRTYLADAKAARDQSELKRIAARNKKFVLAFADECDGLLHYLDFTPITDEDTDVR